MRLPFRDGAPVRPRLRGAGAFVLAALLGAGCERGDGPAADDMGPRVLELDSSRIELPDSVRQLVITLDRTLAADMDRPSATLRVGDIVRFEAKEGTGHAIAFDGATLAPEVRAWLEATGQLRGPPLLQEGNAWVVTLEGAPPGEYPFSCVTHGAAGRLTVSAR